jgi:hypothetical protein
MYPRPELAPYSEKGLVMKVKPHQPVAYRANIPFEDDLLVTTYFPHTRFYPGYFLLQSRINGQTYPMLPRLLLDAMQRMKNIERGLLRGLWEVTEANGQFFSLMLVEER